MRDETLTATTTVPADAGAVFAVLTDPSTRAAIDGTGWVREPHETACLDHVGQVFGMAMYHSNHPDGHYEMANEVTVLDAPRTVAWKPGQHDDAGQLQFGGWIWRYDLRSTGTPEGSATEVTLTYDWSAVPEFLREHIRFPPFGVDHLDNSLAHLAELATTS